MKINMNKTENFIWIIFTVIGGFFLIAGIITCIFTLDYKDKVDTKGTITGISSYKGSDGERHYGVYVEYYVDEQRYVSKLNSYSSNFFEGKELNIYYNKEKPNEIGVKKLDLLFLIFPSFGLVFVIIGGTGLFVKFNKRKIEKNLKENGDKILANYIDTIMNTHYSVNGRHPYNIICEWENPDNGEIYKLKSKNIWDNPKEIIEEKDIKNFTVYMNPNKRKQYIIDIEEITE